MKKVCRRVGKLAAIMLGLCLGGLGLSIVWFGLALRAERFVHHYAEFGRAMESDQLKIEGPFRSAEAFLYASVEIVRLRLSTASQSIQTTR